MRITWEKNVVGFEPQSPTESVALQTLWNRLISCTGISAKLAPIGEFGAGRSSIASFVIEGGDKKNLNEPSVETVAEDGTYICSICNRYIDLNAGADVPLCCGRLMERMD